MAHCEERDASELPDEEPATVGGEEMSSDYYDEVAEFSEMKIFAGSSSPELAREICAHLGISLGRAFCGKFADGEIAVQVLDEVRGGDVYVLQSAPHSEKDTDSAFMELLLMTSALRRSSAKRITAVIPYLSYARQTQVFEAHRPRPIAAADVALMLSTLGVDRVILVDVHNPRMEGFFPTEVPVHNIDAQALAVQYFKKKHLEKVVVVATDNMGGERTKAFWNRLTRVGIDAGLASMVSNRPERSRREGSPLVLTPPGSLADHTIITQAGEKKNVASLGRHDWLVGDVKGCDCIIVDDIIDTGSRAFKTANFLKKAGARRIFMYATHGVFSKGAIDRINKSPIDELIVTNSIPLPNYIFSEKLRVLSIGKLLAETIRRVHTNSSVSVLFQDAFIAKQHMA